MPRVSGALAAHYAPRTPLMLLQPDVVIFAVREALAANERLGVIAPMACPISDERIVWRQIAGEPAAFAQRHLRVVARAGRSELCPHGCPEAAAERKLARRE